MPRLLRQPGLFVFAAGLKQEANHRGHREKERTQSVFLLALRRYPARLLTWIVQKGDADGFRV